MKRVVNIKMAGLLMAGLATILLSRTLSADEGPGHRRGGIPGFLLEQLSDEQVIEFKNAESREARKQLLDSWGIAPPARHEFGKRSKKDCKNSEDQANSSDEQS